MAEKQNIALVLLETILEHRGAVATCPVEYNKDRKKWFFWDETSTQKSTEYDTLAQALEGLEQYCATLDIGGTAA